MISSNVSNFGKGSVNTGHVGTFLCSYKNFITDVGQPWTNYVNNGNKYLIIGAVVSSEYSNIWYLHLIIGKAQKFVSGDKNDFWR